LPSTLQTTAKSFTYIPAKITMSQRRIVINRTTKTPPNASPLQIRDIVNKSLINAKAPGNTLVAAVNCNSQGSLILITHEKCTSIDVLKYKSQIYNDLIKVVKDIQAPKIDQKWGKVILHGVSISEFRGEEGMSNLKHEIETFNPSTTLVTSPRWLTSPEKQIGKAFSSVVLAVQSLSEAEVIIKKGLLVYGRKLKAEKFLDMKPTDQCSKCQSFGHHSLRCSREPKCQICGANHETFLHKCNKCNTTGKSCPHSTIRCANCGQNHKANDPSCEVIKAVRSAEPVITATPMEQ
jgi:hypothetical protein